MGLLPEPTFCVAPLNAWWVTRRTAFIFVLKTVIQRR
jgi:hypothetical protein